MILEGREKIEATEALLREAGFAVSQICCSRPSCFDFAARKSKTLILVKLELDIDNLSPGNSTELKVISECFSATSILVSEKAREKPLEDDTVYSRYNVSAMTSKTFENIMLRKKYPLVQAGPGGYYVEIDSQAIKRRRQKLGLSVGEMAEMVGISRRTLYGYEHGMAKASVAVAYNLAWTLGIPVAESINILGKSKGHRTCFLTKAKRVFAKYKLLQRISGKFDRYNVKTMKKAPFDFVIAVPEEKMKIIGGVANENERELNRRVDEILSVSKIVQAHPILITEEKKLVDKDITCINKEELSKIKTPEDLIANAR
ncbi:MAG: helix-turn-helix domain-containing protein [Candidatus Bathyarchaeota archaeon]|nr:helix-turn-helix domain-containing protein [Candidatus Bathyarchaeota archaeon]MDH5787768.1 helix-turn-helix domain-containing protein [Candidatus Bathyarchaeota archaeon]